MKTPRALPLEFPEAAAFAAEVLRHPDEHVTLERFLAHQEVRDRLTRRRGTPPVTPSGTIAYSPAKLLQARELVQRAARTLGCRAPVVHMSIAANINGLADGRSVILTSSAVRALDPQELACILGHELGHVILPRSGLSNILASSESGESLSSAAHLDGCAYARVREVSADRFSLLTVDDLDAVAGALTKTRLQGTVDDAAHERTHLTALPPAFVDPEYDGVTPWEGTHPSPGIRLAALAIARPLLKARERDRGAWVEVNRIIRELMDREARDDRKQNQDLVKLVRAAVERIINAARSRRAVGVADARLLLQHASPGRRARVLEAALVSSGAAGRPGELAATLEVPDTLAEIAVERALAIGVPS